MNLLKTIVLVGLLNGPYISLRAQGLPPFLVDRRMDTVYMDSLSRVAKQRYQRLEASPQTAQNDTLRFKTLYYLSHLYKWWIDRRDSTVYFSQELVEQARRRHNLFYEVHGKLLLEDYYHKVRLNTPLALRINFEILTLLQKADPILAADSWQINLNLGDLYRLSKDYGRALQYMKNAQYILSRNPYLPPDKVTGYQIAVEQNVGALYNQQHDFKASEEHYRLAESLLSSTQSESAHAYIYDDLAELYLNYERYEQALGYAKRAEAIWNRIKPHGESNSWGTLACVYSGLGQDELAFQYAQKVLHLPAPTKFVREQAYIALHQVFEHRQDWKNSALYYKKRIALRDTIANETQSHELALIQKQNEFALLSLQKKAEFDRLALHNEQARQLQAERLLTIEKEAELNRLRAEARTDLLTKQSMLAEQQRRFDNERAKIELLSQQTAHRLQQQAFEKKTLQQQNQLQQDWILFIVSSSLLLLGVLALLLYSAQLRKRKAETDLRLAQERKTADSRIIQTQEAERQRIAADLHDDLGGTLATLRRRLTDLRQHLHQPAGVWAFDDLQPLMQKSSDDLRRIAHNLMPPEFSRIGLQHALKQLIHHQPAQPTRFSFLTAGAERKLPLDTELNAYRIVSELIQNINKHAQAGQAAIQMLYLDDRLTITVEDDGLGNRATVPADEQPGIGLATSRLRAGYIGANLWRDVSEAGTLVVLDIPYATLPGADQPPYSVAAD